MESKELRIGNSILINGHIIPQIGYGAIMDLYQKEKGLKNAYLNSISFAPIPISEEYLLKLGFEKSDIVPQNSKEVAWQLPDDETFYIVLGEDPSICLREYGILSYFDYIHELQNLYYAIDGKEIMFK